MQRVVSSGQKTANTTLPRHRPSCRGEGRFAILFPYAHWLYLEFGVGTGDVVGVKKTGKGRRKLGRKKRRMRAKIRHRKG
jgi:hypothetical protein